ncbi:ATP-binding cassette domain-containing protein [Cupriavidus sp. WKF15]|uniref:ATP-binding cassette domain-containing protein n=1 Tax=Cupriavidus sp. WKF15 TaxID=3032282 RepID=UPI0023E20038|nr:ATP-binding cassette domain-containing protein [Cupriavidus sp. WKF15]WER48497.1 ATP-binding cassette domain-containing protein [Cupriavidus sp. WKF15]
MKRDVIIAADALSLWLDGRAVLDNVRLAVGRGRVTALEGPAGAGKSALLGILAGKLSPYSGTVEIDGQSIAGMSPHALARLGVRYVGPPGRVAGARTVHDCIALGAQVHVRGHHVARAQADEVARRLGLEFQLDKAAASLRPALSKRLALACAIAARAHLLLLDEIMAGLNAAEAARMAATIRGLRTDAATVLMAERAMPHAAMVADDVLVLADGKLVASSSAAARESVKAPATEQGGREPAPP